MHFQNQASSVHGHRMVLCPLRFVHTLGTQVYFRPLCSVSRHQFCKRSVARSYGYAKKLIVGKPPRNQRKTHAHRDQVPTLVPEYKVSTQGPGAHFSARVQGLDLVLRHRHRARILARVLKKRCVHISAHRRPYSGTGAPTPSVNAPLENCTPLSRDGIKDRSLICQ